MHDVISQPPLDQQKLRALLEAAERLTSTLSRDDVLNHILAIGGELTASEAGSVILYDPDQNNLYFAAATGPSAEQVRALRIPIGKGKAGMVFETGEPLIENTLKDHYKAVDQKAHFTTHSMICVPLVFATKTYGVLQFMNKHPDQGPTTTPTFSSPCGWRISPPSPFAMPTCSSACWRAAASTPIPRCARTWSRWSPARGRGCGWSMRRCCSPTCAVSPISARK